MLPARSDVASLPAALRRWRPLRRAAAYAVRAVREAAADPAIAGDDEIRWQLDAMSAAVREALRQLPALGADPSGPLGSGLLTTGVLGSTVRTIQAAIAGERGSHAD
jgi:hypothetical protein